MSRSLLPCLGPLLISTLSLAPGLAHADELDVTTRHVTLRPPLDGTRLDEVTSAHLATIPDELANLTAPEIVQLARELADLAESLTTHYGSNSPFLDLLGRESGSLFPDPTNAPGTSGERTDGLPADAPPSGWGFGGLAFQDGVIRGGQGSMAGSRYIPAGNATDISSTSMRQGPYRITMSSWVDHGSLFSRWMLHFNGRLVWSKLNRDGRTIVLNEGVAWKERKGDPVIDHKGGAPEGDKPQGETESPKFEKPAEKPKQPTDKATNPGNDLTGAQRAWAQWLWNQHNLGRHNPTDDPSLPTHMNPGDPDYDGTMPIVASIWDVLAEDALVINPDPTKPTVAHRVPTDMAWAIMQPILNGGTPGGRPIGPN